MEEDSAEAGTDTRLPVLCLLSEEEDSEWGGAAAGGTGFTHTVSCLGLGRQWDDPCIRRYGKANTKKKGELLCLGEMERARRVSGR